MTDLSLPPGIAARVTAEALLHRGRTGTTYLARSQSGTVGVLRMLDTGLTRSATDRMRIARGLDKLTTVSHPSLVVPSEHGEDGGQLWYLRPHIDGLPLSERLAQGPLPVAEALSVGGQVADALHALHRAGLLHRDLCPERIILQADGRAVLIDATVAAPVDAQHERVFGTASFVAPEEVEGKPASFRSDLYALGAILYASLAGEAPFEGPIADVLRAQVDTPPPPLTVDLSDDVRSLLDQLLDKEPRRRPFSAQKVARTLLSYIPQPLRPSTSVGGAPSAVRPPVAAAPRPAAPPKRAPKATLLGVPAVVPAAEAPEPVTARRSAPPPLPGGARQPSIPPPIPTAAHKPSVPPAAPAGRSAKRTMVGMPAVTQQSTPFRDDATQQVQLEQIVEARELRGKTPSAIPPPVLGTSSSPARDDSTQQVGFEQIVEVRASRAAPPPPPLDQTARDLPAVSDGAGFDDDEPTAMFDGTQTDAIPLGAPPASVEMGFDDEEPTRMFDGATHDDLPTTEIALPAVAEMESQAASAPSAADGEVDADDAPTSMFSASDMPASEPPPAMGLAAPIISVAGASQAPPTEPTTAPLGTMPAAPPPRASAPPPLAAAARASEPPPPAPSAAVSPPAPRASVPPPLRAESLSAVAAVPPSSTDTAAMGTAPPAVEGARAVAPAATGSGEPALAHPIPADEKPARRWMAPVAAGAVLLLLGTCGVGAWLLTTDGEPDTTATGPGASGPDSTTLTAPALAPDAGLASASPDLGAPDMGAPDLGVDLGADLGAPDLGTDLGAPDLGADLGPPDLGVEDAGEPELSEADQAAADLAFMNGPRPRGRAERARWLRLRRQAAAANMATRAPGSANASAAAGVRERARAATSSGNHAEATRLYEQLTRMTPSSASAWYSLGVSRMRQRNGRGAAAALEQATRLSPRNATYWATLGTARRNAGDAGGSRAAYQQALRYDPNNAVARRGLGQ